MSLGVRNVDYHYFFEVFALVFESGGVDGLVWRDLALVSRSRLVVQ
jgi:hypothetical protein